ncbi:MAG: hypothetical protein ABSA90_04815 [Xanthobacteraceae bacterium]|jgi:hypothetical protein
MQRIGLDRIDFPLRPPARDQLARDTEHQTAGERYGDRHHRIEPQQSRQTHAGLEVKEQTVQDVDPGTHEGHDHAGDGADQRR